MYLTAVIFTYFLVSSKSLSYVNGRSEYIGKNKNIRDSVGISKAHELSNNDSIRVKVYRDFLWHLSRISYRRAKLRTSHVCVFLSFLAAVCL